MRDNRPPLRLGAATTTLAILPLLTAHHLPLLDAPGHEAGLAVLHNLIFGGGVSPFYERGSLFIPDLAFDGIGLALMEGFSPETAGRVFMGATLALTLSGLVVLNRVVTERWSRMPLAAALLLYNLISMFGFFSFLFGLALVPWTLAARLRLPALQVGRGLLLGAALGVALLFCHVLAFGIYATFWVGVTGATWVGGRIGWLPAFARVLELVPALGLFFAMPQGGPGGTVYEAPFVPGKLVGILESLSSGSRIGDLALIAGLIVLTALLRASDRVSIAKECGSGLVCLSLLYLALPLALGTGSNLDKRIPVAIALLGIACLDVRLHPTSRSRLLVWCLVAALVVKQGALSILWRSFDSRIDSVLAALAAIPPGSVVLQSECHPGTNLLERTYAKWQPSLTHVAALASLDDRRFIASTWAIPGQQAIAIKQRYRPYNQLQTSFASSTCDLQEYRRQLALIRDLAARDPEHPPIYFLLIRPPVADSLTPEAVLRATGPDFELYGVSPP